MSLAPVALFIYRRPEHTRRTLQSLLACTELAQSPLYVFCDGAKTADAGQAVREARRVAHSLAPKHAVFVEREQNLGLASSIIGGVTQLCREHGKVIVVEDDLEVSPAFLRFMNAALDLYADDERVMQVSGYQFPVSLSPEPRFFSFPTSWGWATWARAWAHFDEQASGYAKLRADVALRRRFDLDGAYPYFEMLENQRAGRIDSWAIRWHLSVFQREGVVLYPGRSLVKNNGFDGSGTHGDTDDTLADTLSGDYTWDRLPSVGLDIEAQARVLAFLTAWRQRGWNTRMNDLLNSWRRSILSNPAIARSRAIPNALRNFGRTWLAQTRFAPASSNEQDLDLYWDPKMAAILDTWGEGNAWNEIQLLLANVRGSVVDIACGTGKVMTLLAKYPALELHGYDISDFLIQKAIDRGIARERLTITDACKTTYADNQFDYGYSIGSLEHFTEDGIVRFVHETHRITKFASFHMIPVSRTGWNEGWMKTVQSFHNNSVDWWLERYRRAYSTVHVLDSKWEDQISLGKWFLCIKQAP